MRLTLDYGGCAVVYKFAEEFRLCENLASHFFHLCYNNEESEKHDTDAARDKSDDIAFRHIAEFERMEAFLNLK